MNWLSLATLLEVLDLYLARVSSPFPCTGQDWPHLEVVPWTAHFGNRWRGDLKCWSPYLVSLGRTCGQAGRRQAVTVIFIQVGQGATMSCVAQRAELRVRGGDGQGYKRGNRFEMM